MFKVSSKLWAPFCVSIYKLFFLFLKQVVYINGRPFVLRDVEQPFSNLEYTVCHCKEILLL
jgi:hypothetical protein